jgi:hypothetical protein
MKALGPSPSTVRRGSTCGDRGHHAGAMLAWNESHVGMEKVILDRGVACGALGKRDGSRCSVLTLTRHGHRESSRFRHQD